MENSGYASEFLWAKNYVIKPGNFMSYSALSYRIEFTVQLMKYSSLGF